MSYRRDSTVDNFQQHSQGVRIQVLREGDNTRFPKRGDKIHIHYVCKLMSTGEIVDDSRDRGPFPTEIGTGKVIKGWDEGIMRMSRGQKALLTISPNLAYGANGSPPNIPPNEHLQFEIELLEIFPC
ncbi:hypothetical protein HYPSUDRAFT_1073243 [Hypholoma sublateritium FD-334 SS-4]|uniref:peptidylprolyl isomerase n=1 Tax=Hypholoma sublateritium (strain FD-334 SS-4) TaxID=945553 RepID=A0A0D2LC84_HYPSF|nr:hypothetical protein HYPSUDRAFT_1073243 [Hypholoma sublateritium FD-334 SS-4]